MCFHESLKLLVRGHDAAGSDAAIYRCQECGFHLLVKEIGLTIVAPGLTETDVSSETFLDTT